jgi:Ca2+-binding RTX toxin-like protein
LLAALLVPTTAHAAEVTNSGSTVTYTAAPGENNQVLVTASPYDIACGTLPTPCLTVDDSGARITAQAPCQLILSNPIAGDRAACPLPGRVIANLGDRDDTYWDWDGPSTVDGGAGNDAGLYGRGGDDEIHGGIGSDILLGQDGDDTLDGGPGDDYLEGVAYVEEEVTHGRDTYVGGGGGDQLTYEGRTENLQLSPDGVADDGAPGEGDNIGPDITTIVAGHGSDTLTGNANRNVFAGGEGEDTLTGAGGDDQLAGGPGNDRLTGDDGQDVLGGDSGDDTLDGGAGVDRFYGDDVGGCLAYSCSSGQDLILARDGNQEQIDCGAGTDTLIGDPIDAPIDNLYLSDRCETFDGAPTKAATQPPTFKASARRTHGRIVVTVTVSAAGTVRIGHIKRKLARAGTVKVTLRRGKRFRVTYTPLTGTPQTRIVRLRKPRLTE